MRHSLSAGTQTNVIEIKHVYYLIPNCKTFSDIKRNFFLENAHIVEIFNKSSLLKLEFTVIVTVYLICVRSFGVVS